MTDRTPWAAMLAAALSRGLGPACFWRLSLREWRAISWSHHGAMLPRAAFVALVQRFPDIAA